MYAFIVSEEGDTKGFIRMILDGRSQLTFIKKLVSKELKLPVIGTHRLSIFL